jgi:hypothetical protein
VPHGFVDGIGFQSLLALLTDASPLGAPAAAKPLEESVPSDAAWRAAAERRFAEEAPAREAQAAARREAEAALAKLAEDATRRRTKTPLLGRHGGPTTAARRYETLSMPLERFKSIGQRLDGTVNDVFLAVTGGALRRYLLENNDLPEGPVVVNSARSYRRAEHGDWGNRIVALHPHVATDTANPLERFRGIRESMARELDRSRHDEILVDRLEWPYGPKKRREVLAARVGSGERLLPGNITVSNVPGPSGPRYLAGFRQIANYPAPILGNGRFLNLTLRRNAANLDLGIMCDAGKVSDAGAVRLAMLESLDEIEAASGAAS